MYTPRPFDEERHLSGNDNSYVLQAGVTYTITATSDRSRCTQLVGIQDIPLNKFEEENYSSFKSSNALNFNLLILIYMYIYIYCQHLYVNITLAYL
jgi:hypothetical protein